MKEFQRAVARPVTFKRAIRINGFNRAFYLELSFQALSSTLYHTPLTAKENPGEEIPVSTVFFEHNILTLTRLGDEDDGAAETGVTETTRVATFYPHPTNDKIKFWDLPGIGACQILVVIQQIRAGR
jgi:hypothetical protein